MKNSGYLVEHKDGRMGRTFHKKEPINGKIPVYFATEVKEFKHGHKMATSFSEKAILVSPENLKQIGFID